MISIVTALQISWLYCTDDIVTDYKLLVFAAAAAAADIIIILIYTLRLLSPDVASFAPQTPTSSLCGDHSLHSETGVLPLRDQACGTVFPHHCDSLTLNLDTLNVY